MARKDIENSILRSLQQDWDVANDPEDIINELQGLAYGDEGARKVIDGEFEDDQEAALKAKPFTEQLQLQKEARRAMDGEDRNEEQRARRKAEFDKLDNRQRFGYGLNQAFGEGKIDHQKAFWNARSSQDLDIEAPKIKEIFGTNATSTRARDLIRESKFIPGFIRNFAGSNAADYESRKDAGLGLMSDGYARAGQVAGTLLSDINQDRTRSFWWLMNAPQAAVNVAQEYGLSRSASDLYSSDKITDDQGFELTLDKDNYKKLAERDLISFDPEGNPVLAPGVNRVNASDSGNVGKIALSKRRYRPGMVDALQLPAALAINSGVGLLNPLGGSNGYSAVFESEDDPTKTSNVVGEVAAKYILGRTGNMLPWDEFKKVRPDVSKDEYMRYKAFKYDKEGDWNPLDGDFTVPTGILKGTTEGIHGPEIQFLGRSIPLLTTMLPVAAAGIGTAMGAKWQPEKFNEWSNEKQQMKDMRDAQITKIKKRNLSEKVRDSQIRDVNNEIKEAKRRVWLDKEVKSPGYHKEYMGINRVRNGIVSGLASYGVGLGAGLLLENERRRRNEIDNESAEIQF